jgi:hypothetical protein
MMLTRLVNDSSSRRADKYRLDRTNCGSHGGVKARRILGLHDGCPASHYVCLGRMLGGVLSLHSEAGGGHGLLYRHIFSTVHSQTL